jgi:hypothetical protein
MNDDYGIAKPSPATNQSVPPTDCRTCGGDRFVTVRLRSPETTIWMTEHGLKANPKEFHEEVAPCPDCHPVEVTYFAGNRRFRSMDASAARQALSQ